MDLDDKTSEIVDDAQNGSAPSTDVTDNATAAEADQAHADAGSPTASSEPTDVEIVEATLAKMRPDAEPKEPDPEAKEADGEGEPDDKAKAEAKDAKAGEPEGKEKDDRLSGEEMKSLPAKTRDRIHTLTRERHEHRERAEQAAKQVEELQPRAEAFETIDGALKESNLSYQDLGDLVTVGAVIKSGDPEQIIKALAPYWNDAQQALGNNLTPEFQAKVDASELSVEAAQEAQRTQMSARRTQQELDARKAAETQATQAEQQRAQLVQTLTDATNDEFTRLTANHPDPQSLVPQMQEGIKSYVAEHGAITDPQAARLLVQHVHRDIMAKAAKPAPAPKKATPPAPDPTGPTAAAPKEPVTNVSILKDVLSKTRPS